MKHPVGLDVYGARAAQAAHWTARGGLAGRAFILAKAAGVRSATV